MKYLYDLAGAKCIISCEHNAINTFLKHKVTMCAKVLNTLDFAAGACQA